MSKHVEDRCILENSGEIQNLTWGHFPNVPRDVSCNGCAVVVPLLNMFATLGLLR